MKLTPFKHQAECLKLSWEKKNFAILLEQGLGKTKVCLDTAELLFKAHRIEAMLVIAPNGVHSNWARDQIPLHLDCPYVVVEYGSSRVKAKYFDKAVFELMAPTLRERRLRVLIVNVEAYSSPRAAYNLSLKLLDKFPTLMVVDECFTENTLISTPEGKRPIKTLKKGDLISGAFGPGLIKKVHKGQSNFMVELTLANGFRIMVTPNHPFFTEKGWTCAGNLKEEVLYDEEKTRLLWEKDKEKDRGNLATDKRKKILQHILFSELEDETAPISNVNIYKNPKSKDKPTSHGKKERKIFLEQGHFNEAQEQEKIKPNIKGNAPYFLHKGRKWKTCPNSPAFNAVRLRPALEDGARHLIGEEATRLSNQLQGRPCLGRKKKSGGDRRQFSQFSKTKNKRSKEKQGVEELRVVSVKIIKLICPVNVYNLEINGPPYYFAGGVLVHNSTRIKTPRAQRTKRILGLGRHAKYRRILTGTPVTQSPFDVYSQFAFLDYGILGFFSYTSFKHNYGRWEKRFTQRGDKSWEYDELIEYIHLDDLRQRLKPYCYRREKAECLDLPPKIYKVMGVDLSLQQRRLYQQVEKEGVLEFDDFRLLTPLQITRLLRCQQITGGFLPTGEQGVARPLRENPKLDLMLELIEDHPGQTIIWARFRAEIAAIAARLKEAYGCDQVVEYHGGVPSNKRPWIIKAFQTGKARFLVGQQASGVGVDLYAAEIVFYFSNDFSYDHRYQSEDRCHRIGLLHPVLYVDLIANDTMDERIRWVHERARKAAVAVLGKG